MGMHRVNAGIDRDLSQDAYHFYDLRHKVDKPNLEDMKLVKKHKYIINTCCGICEQDLDLLRTMHVGSRPSGCGSYMGAFGVNRGNIRSAISELLYDRRT